MASVVTFSKLTKHQASLSGLTTVVAAGNDGQDACNVSPAAADHVITVGGLDSQNRPSVFAGGSSNTGYVALYLKTYKSSEIAWTFGHLATALEL